MTALDAGERPTTDDGARHLSAADDMLAGYGPAGVHAVDGGWWPKACACLIRLGLERGLDAFWRRRTLPSVRSATSG